MRVLVVNVGSSSLKHALVDTAGERIVAAGEQRWEPDADGGRHAAALRDALTDTDPHPDAIGHRVVHGGDRFHGPALLDAQVRAEIAELVELAPLHNRAAIEGIDAAMEAFPRIPHVACFDTAFHSTLSHAAGVYAIPHEWAKRYGIRRFGFHGLNVEWCAERARDLLGVAQTRRMVVCHIGSGSSITAVLEGRSVDTTMGFTPLEGVMMATRSGSIDPGVLLFLARAGVGTDELERGLNYRSGLLGLSGRSADLRTVIAAADKGDERCQLAFEGLVRSIAAATAAMTTAVVGLDCLVFTAGAGEGSAPLRAAICERISHLHVAIDHTRNGASEPDTEIASQDSNARVLILRAAEELIIARQTAEIVEQDRMRAGQDDATTDLQP